MEASAAQRAGLFTRAVNALAASPLGGRRGPVLYDYAGRPLRPFAGYQYKKTAAKREGSLQNWIPKRLFSSQSQAMERERIVERSIDLVDNDPHAAGIVDNFATMVVGAGLRPHPMLDAEALGLDKDEARRIQAQMRQVYDAWSPWADAAERMTAPGVQFLLQRNMIEFGEFIVVLPMLRDPVRPYSLAAQVIHPMRLKTPVDLVNKHNIRDGVELGEYGQPVAYWIKRADPNDPTKFMSDHSGNFLRMPARKGHRWNVIHAFIQEDPEQVRGWPFMTPAMKMFRDLSDYLDAELVANVVAAAYALFIETGDLDPKTMAEGLIHHTEDDDDENLQHTIRYEEIIPGSVMYGKRGQKPHPIASNRPGATFEPFVREIKKALAMCINLPYVVAFKDVSETNYAGFRSAMLDAWRVLSHRRTWLGGAYCHRVRSMLLEEAWLRGGLDIDDFYGLRTQYCACQWIGSPKGNIEPVKEAQGDILRLKNNLTTHGRIIAEDGGDWAQVFDEREEQTGALKERGLSASADETVPVKEGTDEPD